MLLEDHNIKESYSRLKLTKELKTFIRSCALLNSVQLHFNKT